MSMWTGPRPAGPGDVEGLGEHARQVIGIPDEVVVLGHRQGDAVDVDLLEGILADQRAGHVAGDRDHRDRVEEGGADARHEVGRARPRRAQADPHPAGDPGIAVGGMGPALLVADQHVAQLGVIAQHVVERQDHAAGIAEEDVDALAQERLAHDIGADPAALERLGVAQHRVAGVFNGGRSGRAVIGHVTPPNVRRGGRPARRACAAAGCPGSPFVIVIGSVSVILAWLLRWGGCRVLACVLVCAGSYSPPVARSRP